MNGLALGGRVERIHPRSDQPERAREKANSYQYQYQSQKKEKKVSEKVEKIVCIGTRAGDDPEKAATPFVMANAALAMDMKATVILQGNGVYLAQKGYVDKMLPSGGFPHMKKLLADFLEQGGELLLCGPCIQKREISEDELVEGAKVSGAGSFVLASIEADAVFTY